MERRLKKAVRSWLDAESARDANRAEAALRAVFLRLPVYAPPSDFVDRVLLRLGIRSEELTAHRGLTLQLKGVLGLCYVLAGLAVMWLPGFLGSLWSGLGPGKAIEVGAGVLVALTERLAEGIAVWGTLSGVARVVSTNVASPAVLSAVAAAALIGVIAFRLLHGLLVTEKDARYVQPG